MHKAPTESIDQVQSNILWLLTYLKSKSWKGASQVNRKKWLCSVIFRIPADTADKALGVVCASESRDHLSCDEAVTAIAARAIQALVVCRADVVALLLEEARSSQVAVAHCGENRLQV